MLQHASRFFGLQDHAPLENLSVEYSVLHTFSREKNMSIKSRQLSQENVRLLLGIEIDHMTRASNNYQILMSLL